MSLNHRLVHRSIPKMASTILPAVMTLNDTNCAICGMGPPPNLILSIPPPPVPAFLQQGSETTSRLAGVPINGPQVNNSLCNFHCEWKIDGVQYVELPHQGNVFDDTWFLVLVLSCIGIILVSVLLVILLLRCKFNTSHKGGGLSLPAASITQPKNVRIPSETVLYPCTDGIQDSRIMWATLTPRGTTRHYLEEHTYETVGNGVTNKMSYPASSVENIYIEPPITTLPLSTKDETAFDNTGFVDYEEPLSMKVEYVQLNEVLEPDEGNLYDNPKDTYRPRVSSPTRIEHPNLPPLNLHPHNRTIRKGSAMQFIGTDTILRNTLAMAAYTPDI